MARNAIKKSNLDDATEGARAEDAPERPAMSGGALGVVQVSTELKVHGAAVARVHSGRRMKEPVVPPARQFEVTAAPPNGVMYGGFRVPMRVGKIVTDQSCNLKVLTDQGVRLREIVPEPAPAASALEEAPAVADEEE